TLASRDRLVRIAIRRGARRARDRRSVARLHDLSGAPRRRGTHREDAPGSEARLSATGSRGPHPLELPLPLRARDGESPDRRSARVRSDIRLDELVRAAGTRVPPFLRPLTDLAGPERGPAR